MPTPISIILSGGGSQLPDMTVPILYPPEGYKLSPFPETSEINFIRLSKYQEDYLKPFYFLVPGEYISHFVRDTANLGSKRPIFYRAHRPTNADPSTIQSVFSHQSINWHAYKLDLNKKDHSLYLIEIYHVPTGYTITTNAGAEFWRFYFTGWRLNDFIFSNVYERTYGYTTEFINKFKYLNPFTTRGYPDTLTDINYTSLEYNIQPNNFANSFYRPGSSASSDNVLTKPTLSTYNYHKHKNILESYQQERNKTPQLIFYYVPRYTFETEASYPNHPAQRYVDYDSELIFFAKEPHRNRGHFLFQEIPSEYYRLQTIGNYVDEYLNEEGQQVVEENFANIRYSTKLKATKDFIDIEYGIIPRPKNDIYHIHSPYYIAPDLTGVYEQVLRPIPPRTIDNPRIYLNSNPNNEPHYTTVTAPLTLSNRIPNWRGAFGSVPLCPIWSMTTLPYWKGRFIQGYEVTILGKSYPSNTLTSSISTVEILGVVSEPAEKTIVYCNHSSTLQSAGKTNLHTMTNDPNLGFGYNSLELTGFNLLNPNVNFSILDFLHFDLLSYYDYPEGKTLIYTSDDTSNLTTYGSGSHTRELKIIFNISDIIVNQTLEVFVGGHDGSWILTTSYRILPIEI